MEINEVAEEIRRRGIEALAEALVPVDAALVPA